MNYPKISIVTVNYNKSKYLERTILSVLNQNYPNLEYIIIDGGSTDNSVEIIKKYADRLTYWVSEPDNGMYDALKKGFAHTTGDILAWINSDDMYHRNAFYVVAELFTSMDHVDWLVGATSHWDENDRCVYVKESPYLNRVKFLMGDWKYVQQESTFWRRSLYEKVGGIDTDYKLAGDFGLWMKFSRYAKMYVVNAPLGGFRISKDGQLSDNFEKYTQEVEAIIRNEQIDKESATIIADIRKKQNRLNWIQRLTRNWLNMERLQRRFFKDQQKELYLHQIRFDRKLYHY